MFASILPYASDEANQSGSERPTYHSVDIFWNGFGKQRKRSSGRAGETAHRIQKTCVLFFAVLPLFLFRVRIHPLTEDIPISLRRALADATPSLPALNFYLRQF